MYYWKPFEAERERSPAKNAQMNNVVERLTRKITIVLSTYLDTPIYQLLIFGFKIHLSTV